MYFASTYRADNYRGDFFAYSVVCHSREDVYKRQVQENPDILCLQETKLQPDQYPAEVFEALGYKAYLYSAQKKGYSGVAILTKQEPDHVEYGMGIEAYDNEGRFIRADFGDLSVVSVYHPSGTSGDERQAFKMVWLEDFQKYVTELRKTCLLYTSRCV